MRDTLPMTIILLYYEHEFSIFKNRDEFIRLINIFHLSYIVINEDRIEIQFPEETTGGWYKDVIATFPLRPMDGSHYNLNNERHVYENYEWICL